jgi:hypothetical protein
MHKEKTVQNLYWNAVISYNLVSYIYFDFITDILHIMMFYNSCYDKNVDQMSAVYMMMMVMMMLMIL